VIDAWSVCVERREGRLQPVISEGEPGVAIARREKVTVLLSGEGADGYAARKVDQYAAQKVGHSEGGSFYVVLT